MTEAFRAAQNFERSINVINRGQLCVLTTAASIAANAAPWLEIVIKLLPNYFFLGKEPYLNPKTPCNMRMFMSKNQSHSRMKTYIKTIVLQYVS